jgi:acylphosphatase
METVRLLISGKVQGVFFRETSRKMAEKLNIRGWIKNNPDGKVEAVVTGTGETVEEFIKWCKAGPEKAKVDKVEIEKLNEVIFTRFEVIRNK